MGGNIGDLRCLISCPDTTFEAHPVVFRDSIAFIAHYAPNPDAWGVYARNRDGFAWHVADFYTEDDARALLRALGKRMTDSCGTYY